MIELRRARTVANFKLTPNPVREILTVGFQTNNRSAVVAKVTDITGKVILTSEKAASNGENTMEINVASLQAGSYFITLENGVEVSTQKFVKLQ